jgi:hypothetical protein
VALPPAPAVPVATLGQPAASRLTTAFHQTGFAIRGTVNVRSAGSRLVARALGTREKVLGGASTRELEIGRASRRTTAPGVVAFKVVLGKQGRRALRRNGRMAIRLRVSVDPASGPTYKGSRIVILIAP